MQSTSAPASVAAGSVPPRVCVIGAGVAGIACVKELTAWHINVDAYDMMPILGGVFGSYSWKGGQLTSSSVFTWFSQYPPDNRQTFFTWDAFVAYLQRYAEHYQLADHFHLHCKILAVEPHADMWRVRIKRGNWSNGHYMHPRQEVQEQEFFEDYTHVIVCSGLHNTPAIPAIDGLQQFPGRVLHSQDYRDAEEFRGQRVLVVGSGESASDIAAQIAAVAQQCTIAMRSAPGTLFPRYIQGNTADIRDDRLTYNLPRLWWPLILRGHRRFYRTQRQDRALFQWAAESNYQHQRCPFTTNACKSFGIPEALLHHGAVLKPHLTAVQGSTVTFADQSCLPYDAIIFCTGYTVQWPFLAPDIARRFFPVNTLWKNCLSPEFGTRLCLVGFARPQQINLVSVAEMQARLVALLIAGQKQLPSKQHLLRAIHRDQQWMRQTYGERYAKNPALVDYLYYMDGLATEIGCEVPLLRALWRDPRLWLKLMFASLNGAHYRLRGPGSNWQQAARIIKQTPQFQNWPNAILRWSVLTLLTVVSLLCSLGLKRFRLIQHQARDAG